MSDHKSFKGHLFICTNNREGGKACCTGRGALELREAVKAACKAIPHKPGELRVNAAGCLGHCEEGITAVMYPEGRWFTGLKNDEESRDKLAAAMKESLGG